MNTFKCMIWWVLTNVYTCVTITRAIKTGHFYHPENSLMPLCSQFPSPSSRKPLICLPSLRWVLLLLEFHVNVILLWCLLCSKMFLRIICGVVWSVYIPSCCWVVFIVWNKYNNAFASYLLLIFGLFPVFSHYEYAAININTHADFVGI